MLPSLYSPIVIKRRLVETMGATVCCSLTAPLLGIHPGAALVSIIAMHAFIILGYPLNRVITKGAAKWANLSDDIDSAFFKVDNPVHIKASDALRLAYCIHTFATLYIAAVVSRSVASHLGYPLTLSQAVFFGLTYHHSAGVLAAFLYVWYKAKNKYIS